jgi:HAD superfamily hydrolase (TIGR01549 family)
VVARLPDRHDKAFLRHADSVTALPGAPELLAELTEMKVPWTIATSSRLETAHLAFELLGLSEDTPIVTRDRVKYAKPDPDLFLAAADQLGVNIRDSFVVGDSVWDLLAARRAGTLGVGVLSGGYGRDELETAGAYRVYADPADLLAHLEEVGVRRRSPA